MFVKPFRVKTNTRIRGSERKDLRSKIEATFQSYQFQEPISSIVSNKDEINVLKVFTHRKEIAVVYVINKNPMFFEVEKSLYPTVYFMWTHSKLVSSLTTHTPVITKLANGADLMLPGVVIPLSDIPNFSENSPVAINTEDNSSCFAVGTALKSSKEIFYSKERQGKAVRVLHVFGDYLWEAGERSQPPKVESISTLLNKVEKESSDLEASEAVSSIDQTTCDLQNLSVPDEETSINNDVSTIVICSEVGSKDFQKLQSEQSAENFQVASSEIDFAKLQNEKSDETANTEQSAEEKMSQLLYDCVMTALKVNLKDKELPMPTGTFYRSKVLTCCPPEDFLDIKKTKHKKLSRFLKSIEEIGLIEIKEITKGIDHIVRIDRSHNDLRSFQPLVTDAVEASAINTETQFGIVTQKHYEPPEISLLYGVNTATSQLFGAVGCAKGAVMDASQVRNHVNAYVRDNELSRGQLVRLDPVLHHTVFGKGNVDVEEVKWDALFAKIFSAMQPHHQLQFKGAQPIVKKGNPVKIIVKLEQRMGNKKVTLVHNLEHFFIRPQDFADQIKKKAQSSTSLAVLPGSKPSFPIRQVLIQGNQVRNVEVILTGDCYKLPRKYIDGLSAATKTKGKRK